MLTRDEEARGCILSDTIEVIDSYRRVLKLRIGGNPRSGAPLFIRETLMKNLQAMMGKAAVLALLVAAVASSNLLAAMARVDGHVMQKET